MAGFLTPMQMNAGAGLLQNSGIGISPALTTSITSYTGITAIDTITYCHDNSSQVTGSTLTNLQSLGDGVFPGLTNIVLPTDHATVGAGALTTKVTAHANSLLGADVGVFAQHLSMASAFATSSNEFITSALNADTTFEMNTDINNLITGALTDTSLALPTLASDLLNSGNLLDYNDLRNLGNPMSFVKIYFQQGGGLPVLDKYLTAEGINTAGLTNAVTLNNPSSLVNIKVNELGTSGLTSFPDGVTAEETDNTKATNQGLGQAIWNALGKVKDDDLVTMQAVLNSSIVGLETAQDFMDPKKIFPQTYESLKAYDPNGNKAFIYISQSFNPQHNGSGEEFYSCVPAYIADANQALAGSLQQIKDVFNITSQQLSQVAEKLETTKGLTTIESLSKPVPDTTINFFKNIYGVGSGKNGQFLVTDVIGTCAGFTHTEEFEQLATTVGALDDLNELDNLANLYQTMKNLFDNAATYYTIVEDLPSTIPPTYTETWYIPAGRYGLGASSYGSRNLAVNAVITAIDIELARLQTAYTSQATSTTTNITNSSAQIKRELVNMPKAGLVPADTQTGTKSAVLGLVTNLHDYGADDSLGGTGWILENIASSDFYGESLVAALREGRNIRQLNNAAIGNALAINADTRTSEKATLANASYTVDEAKENL